MGKEIDLLIKGGKVYDGSEGTPFLADIGIADEMISFITPSPGAHTVKPRAVIDAEGLSVAPGFIDTHAHSEFTLLADNRAQGKVCQGVTTEINGNCGLSAAPLYGEAVAHREADVREWGIEERWSTFRQYFDLLRKRGITLNIATLTGHGNLRASVVGYGDRRASRDELKEMRDLLQTAVGEGALGLSSGLIYPPGVYADTEEITELARSIPGHIYTTHMRSEGDSLIEAIEETVAIGRASGIAVHISHIKTGGKENWQKIDSAIAVIGAALAEGIKVTVDRYPYTAASTDLDAVLPSWVYAGGSEDELRRLNNPTVRQKIRREISEKHGSGDYWDNVAIASLNREHNKWMEGRSLAQVSGAVGKSPVDLLLDILIEEELRIGAIFHSMNEENLARFLALCYAMVGSDSSARSFDGPTHRGKPHPRGFGSFPRFLGKYVRDQGLMSLSHAIHKVTMLPAETFGLKNRGRIGEGFIADIVVFDEERIIDRATFADPFQRPEGVYYVLVNGVPVLWDGAATGNLPGRVLMHGV